MTALNQWFERFFDEKNLMNLPYDFEVDGDLQLIDTQTVIDLIQMAPEHEQIKIRETLIRLDFHNADIHHFLRHLAYGYVMTRLGKRPNQTA